MFNRKRVLRYEPMAEHYLGVVKTSKLNVPKWYKDAPQWGNEKPEFINHTKTFKLCSPFLDSITIGYQLCLSGDLLVEEVDGTPTYSWNSPYPLIGVREYDPYLPTPIGYHETSCTWKSPAALNIPLGHSMLVTHPLNRFDLPFQTLNAVIDGGFTMAGDSNIPFFIKKGFVGVIPQGTPIAQLIPFKQEDWNSKLEKGLVKEGSLNAIKSSAVLHGWYKKTFWTKKQYN
jgi:hypothetical protein